ncbi:alpha/beta-type small acid-soluble spore protein [Bacillus cereus]|uniref:alpha/beta-type small acid-soluble spore protein n=1 Tax=Bacillus cereus TaxID=1396 RepID=UPI000BF3856F|nr:alpha/beta-type small acid-soluble spore protein [Bacillus cereus]PFA03145.1 spore protein [Bacillus cereus]
MYNKEFLKKTDWILDIYRHENNPNKVLISDAASTIEQMKFEIAHKLGVTLELETSARANGSVGEEITKRLVRMAKEQYRLH